MSNNNTVIAIESITHKINILTEHKKVMDAFLAGKRIEYKPDGGDEWRQANYPMWNWSSTAYRVAPEPRVLYINTYFGDDYSCYETEQMAKQYATKDCDIVAAKFIEVKQ